MLAGLLVLFGLVTEHCYAFIQYFSVLSYVCWIDYR